MVKLVIKASKMFLAVIGVVALVAIPCLASSSLPALAAGDDPVRDACSANPNASYCQNKPEDNPNGLSDIAKNIINTALYIVGILAVAMIIFSGIRYVTSAGDKGRVEQSKQILIYSIVGLIVAMLAYALVNFVVDRLA